MDASLTLLGLLSSEPGYGYDLKHRYDHYFGEGKSVSFGQVYGCLARMLRDGLALATEEQSGAGPDRKRYEITEAGSHRVDSWLLTAEEPRRVLQSTLFAKTVIALLTRHDASMVLDTQRTAHIDRMREITRLKQNAEALDVVLYDYALFHMEADLRWMDHTEGRLAQLSRKVRQS